MEKQRNGLVKLEVDEETKRAFIEHENPEVRRRIERLHQWRKESLNCNYIF
jgi:hypothetical protein